MALHVQAEVVGQVDSGEGVREPGSALTRSPVAGSVYRSDSQFRVITRGVGPGSGPVGVSAMSYVHHGHRSAVAVDAVDDAVRTAACAVPIVQGRAKLLPDPVGGGGGAANL